MPEVFGLSIRTDKDKNEIKKEKDEGYEAGFEQGRLGVGKGKMHALLNESDKVRQMWQAVKDNPNSGLDIGDLAIISTLVRWGDIMNETIEEQFGIVVGGKPVEHIGSIVSYDSEKYRTSHDVKNGDEVIIVSVGTYNKKTGDPITYPTVRKYNGANGFNFVEMAREYVDRMKTNRNNLI